MNIEERLEKIRLLIQDRDFLESRGLSNEVNIRIFNYDPKDELTVRFYIEKLSADHHLPCRPYICDLYNIFISVCEDMGILDFIPKMADADGNEYLLERLHNAVGCSQFIEKMISHIAGCDIIIIVGVGKVFPFMRIHLLLESMQIHLDRYPILVMYPGVFDGRFLKLFNLLKPNDYYRAFNVI